MGERELVSQRVPDGKGRRRRQSNGHCQGTHQKSLRRPICRRAPPALLSCDATRGHFWVSPPRRLRLFPMQRVWQMPEPTYKPMADRGGMAKRANRKHTHGGTRADVGGGIIATDKERYSRGGGYVGRGVCQSCLTWTEPSQK